MKVALSLRDRKRDRVEDSLLAHASQSMASQRTANRHSAIALPVAERQGYLAAFAIARTLRDDAGRHQPQTSECLA